MGSTRKHDRVTVTARTLLIVLLAGLGGCGTAAAPSPFEPAASPTTVPTATAASTRRPLDTKCTPPSAAPAEAAEGTVTISAPLGATACGFDTSAISAPADAAFEVVLVVEDTVLPHNFSVYTDPEYSDLIAEGKFAIAAGPGAPMQVTTDVPALAAATYYYRCDSHSRTMAGTLTTH